LMALRYKILKERQRTKDIYNVKHIIIIVDFDKKETDCKKEELLKNDILNGKIVHTYQIYK